MLLRPYQEIAVDSASEALDKHGNTVVVAPTGAGKTIMLSALIGQRCDTRRNVLVLQHRDELVNQNQEAGYHSITWNASNQASGMYFAKMIAGDIVQTQKLVLLK